MGSAKAAGAPLKYYSQFGSFGSGSGQFEGASYTAVDPTTGDVWVADLGNADAGDYPRVEKFDASGNFITQVSGFDQIGGIAVDPATGDLYVVDQGNQVVSKFDPNGNFLVGFGGGDLDLPSGIAVDGAGNVYVSSEGTTDDGYPGPIVEYDSNGNYLGTVGNSAAISNDCYGNAALSDPGQLAVNQSTDELYVVASKGVCGGSTRVIGVFQLNGTYVGYFGSYGTGPGQLADPRELSVDPSGNLWVADYGNARTEEFSSGGSYIAQLAKYGSGPGEFEGIWGLASGPNGELYTADDHLNRVQKFGPVRSTSTTVTCSPTDLMDLATTTCTVTVTDTAAGAAVTPTGTVAFTYNTAGTFAGSPCTLSGTGGSASCRVTLTPSGTAGSRTVKASYHADGSHTASSGTTSLLIDARPTTTTVNCSPTSVSVNQAITCTATVTDTGPAPQATPTGTVAFKGAKGDTFSGSPCTLSGSGGTSQCSVTYTPTAVGSGPHTITAKYAAKLGEGASSGQTTVTVTP